MIARLYGNTIRLVGPFDAGDYVVSEVDSLDILATVLDAYEAEHYPMDPPDPVEAMQFRTEQEA